MLRSQYPTIGFVGTVSARVADKGSGGFKDMADTLYLLEKKNERLEDKENFRDNKRDNEDVDCHGEGAFLGRKVLESALKSICATEDAFLLLAKFELLFIERKFSSRAGLTKLIGMCICFRTRV